MPSRIVARSTTAGTPVKSCSSTRAGVKAISFSAAGAWIPARQRRDVVGLDEAAVLVAQQVLEQDLQRVRQARHLRKAGPLERRQADVLHRVAARRERRPRPERIERRHVSVLKNRCGKVPNGCMVSRVPEPPRRGPAPRIVYPLDSTDHTTMSLAARSWARSSGGARTRHRPLPCLEPPLGGRGRHAFPDWTLVSSKTGELEPPAHGATGTCRDAADRRRRLRRRRRRRQRFRDRGTYRPHRRSCGTGVTPAAGRAA